MTRKDCGLAMMYENVEDGSYQLPLFGVSDSLVRISVLPESKKESDEEQGVDSFLKLCGSLMKKKMINPSGLSLKTLKICSQLRGGWGFLRVTSEMAARGYAVQWRVYNSKDYGVPQNRERVYIIGRLGENGGGELLPPARKSERALKKMIDGSQGDRVYEPELSCTLSSQGGGMGAKTGLYVVGHIGKGGQKSRVFHSCGNAGTLSATDYKDPQKVMIDNEAIHVKSILTPDRINKRQNGRRTRVGDGIETAYSSSNTRRARVQPGRCSTITTHGTAGVLTDIYPVRIRKLTPKECWRLQGFSDDQFEKAAAVNSNTQLYKQAGNAVTVNVVEAIGRHIVSIIQEEKK